MKNLSIIILSVFFYGTTYGSTIINNELKTERIYNDNKNKKEKSNCCKSSDKKKECSKTKEKILKLITLKKKNVLKPKKKISQITL